MIDGLEMEVFENRALIINLSDVLVNKGVITNKSRIWNSSELVNRTHNFKTMKKNDHFIFFVEIE